MTGPTSSIVWRPIDALRQPPAWRNSQRKVDSSALCSGSVCASKFDRGGLPMAVRRPMTLESLLLKPYFWRRPSQLIRRMLYVVRPWPNPPLVELPWGLTLECYPGELIGESVMRTGVFEMTTTEALVRLVDPAELVLDVGANVGYMTSLLARAAGPGGRVIAYEPNPAVFQRLATNVDAWHEDRLARIEPRQAAVSDCDGIAPMTIPQGASECAAMGDRPIERAGDGAHITVQVQTVTARQRTG